MYTWTTKCIRIHTFLQYITTLDKWFQSKPVISKCNLKGSMSNSNTFIYSQQCRLVSDYTYLLDNRHSALQWLQGRDVAHMNVECPKCQM